MTIKGWLWSILALLTLGMGSLIGASLVTGDAQPTKSASLVECDTLYTVQGRVTDAQSTPIAATVHVVWVGEFDEGVCTTTATAPQPVVTAQTNSAGYFSLQVVGTRHWLYQLQIESDHHHPFKSPPVNGAYLPYFQDAALQLDLIVPRIFG